MTSRRWQALLASAVIMGGVFLLNGFACNGGSGSDTPPPPPGPAEVITICSSSTVPAGYVKINDNWSPTTCGNPSTITYNVSTYQRYDNKPVGTVLWVCAGWQPSGWAMINTDWNPTACGHPSSISDNIWAIQKF